MQIRISWQSLPLGLPLAILFTLLLALPASARRNEAGVLLLHTDDTVVFTQDAEFDQRSGLACPNYDDGLDCEERMGALDPTSGRGSEPVVWWAFVAFPADTDPYVRAIALGHRWTGDLTILDYGLGADMMDVPDPTWPFESGTGTGVAWRDPQVSRLTEIYWMAGYVEEGEATLELMPHPSQGGAVADDLRNIEPLVGYGRLGLGGAEGFNPSPIAGLELWSSDEVVFFGEVSRLVPHSIELELINLSEVPSSIRRIESSDPRISARFSPAPVHSGGRVAAELELISDELGFVDAVLEVQTAAGFQRHVRVRGEVIEAPSIEVPEGELVLHPRPGTGLGAHGQLVLVNRAPDPRSSLEWSSDLALLPAPSGGGVGEGALWMGAWRNQGAIAGGERYTVDVVTGDVELDPDRVHWIHLTTNDPGRPSLRIPVRIGEADPSGTEGNQPFGGPELPSKAAVRLVSSHPSRGEVMFGLDVPVSSEARFDVHDAIGRRVWSFGGTLSPGSHTVPWSGKAADGPASAGVYWGVLRSQESMTTQRVVLLR